MIFDGIVDLEPRMPYIVFAFILISTMIGLYLYFGLNFISRGKKSKIDAQKSYYKGLGTFIITVAVSESIYLVDFMSRVLYGKRIFNEIQYYESEFGTTIDTLFTGDYFVLIFMLLAFGLIFLASPLEKYLLGRKKKPLTITAAVVIPLPLIARIIEINFYNWTGNAVVEGSVYFLFTSSIWLLNVGVIGVTILILFSLYLKMGMRAPEGSKLRKKSKQIVLGLMIWVLAIGITSPVLKAIWDDGNDWLNLIQTTPNIGRLYFIFPLIIPSLLLLSLALLISGFKREY
ncbi:MAG: hypothetical protein ACTSRZ_00590 [Promethearchaeota archaeon]